MIYKLKEGDKVNIIAPSSFINDNEEFLDGLKIIESWGLKIKSHNLYKRKHGYFSGNDDIRFNELEEAQNSDIIICAKGGWGASRLLEKDPTWKNKWFLGFSDNCSLLLSKYSKGSRGSLHGPTITTLSNEPKWSLERLKLLLFENTIEDIEGKALQRGLAYGRLIVSNLTIFCSLIGTDNLPNCDNKIIIFEDVNEDIYKIDRMFTTLRLTKIFKNIAGIGFGNFFNQTDQEKQTSLENLIFDRFFDFKVPIVLNLPIGHLSGNACIPLGSKGFLNGNNGKLSINLKDN